MQSLGLCAVCVSNTLSFVMPQNETSCISCCISVLAFIFCLKCSRRADIASVCLDYLDMCSEILAIHCYLGVRALVGKVKGRGKPHAGALSVSLACCLFSGLSWALSVWPPVCGRPELEPPAYQHTLQLRPFQTHRVCRPIQTTLWCCEIMFKPKTKVGKTESYKCWFDPAVVNTKAPIQIWK